MKLFLLTLTVFLLGCTSHQYDSMRSSNHSDEATYRIEGNYLIIQIQRYQFIPDTALLMTKTRDEAKRIASAQSLRVPHFDVTTERNELQAHNLKVTGSNPVPAPT